MEFLLRLPVFICGSQHLILVPTGPEHTAAKLES